MERTKVVELEICESIDRLKMRLDLMREQICLDINRVIDQLVAANGLVLEHAKETTSKFQKEVILAGCHELEEALVRVIFSITAPNFTEHFNNLTSTLELSPPNIVYNFSAKNVTCNSVQLRWSISNNTQIFYVEQFTGDVWERIGATRSTFFLVSHLQPETRYEFRLISANSVEEVVAENLSVTTPGKQTRPVIRAYYDETCFECFMCNKNGSKGYKLEPCGHMFCCKCFKNKIFWCKECEVCDKEVAEIGIKQIEFWHDMILPENSPQWRNPPRFCSLVDSCERDLDKIIQISGSDKPRKFSPLSLYPTSIGGHTVYFDK